jgi:hypothetical protein
MNPYNNYNMGMNNFYPNQFSTLTQPQMPTQNLIRVNGIDGAKAYQMSANNTVALFDTNEDIMYVKSTDGAGFPSIRTFSFTEIKENTKVSQNSDYISRQEFEDFKKELMNNGKQSISRSKSNLTTDKSADN